MRLLALVPCVVGLLLQVAHAESFTIRLTVDAGERDRALAPVSTLVVVPRSLSKVTVARFLGEHPAVGNVAQLAAPRLLSQQMWPVQEPGPAMVVRELVFVLKDLKADERADVKLSVSDTEANSSGIPSFHWSDPNEKVVQLTWQHDPVIQYVYEALDTSSKARREETYKPFHHLFDPAGPGLVTKGPGGTFTHHRGLFYGFNRITYGEGKKADVWHATGDAHQSHEAFVSQEAGPVFARQCVAIDWHGEQGEVFAKELRELTVYQVGKQDDEPGYLIEFASRLATSDGAVRLDGDPQHAGFHFRAAQEVSDVTAKQTYYIRPDSVGKPGETINWDPKLGEENPSSTLDQPWKGMSFVVGGQRFTAAYLDTPSNPKEARYSERDYGRFGSYFEYDLTNDKPLELNYRVWLQRGELTGGEIEQMAQDFVQPAIVRSTD